MPLRIFVTTFRTFPYKHWALNIQLPDGNQFECYQISGAAHRFAYETRIVRNPEGTRRWAESIELGHISEDQLEQVRKLAETQELENHDKDWHCQRWTLALVHALKDEGIIQPTEKSMKQLTSAYEKYPSVWDWMCLGYDFNRSLVLGAYEDVSEFFTRRGAKTEAVEDKK